jgi:MFS family permease
MGSGIAFIIGGFVLNIVEQADPLVLPLVGELHAWQQTFLYVGAPGILLALGLLFLREPTRRSASGSLQQDQATVAEIVAFYRRNALTLTFHHIGFLSFALMGYAFVFWTVSFFVRVHGYAAADASQIFGWIFFATGPLGPVLVALFARWLSKRGHKDANITAGMVGGLLAIPTIIVIQFVPSPLWAIVLYVPAMMFINSPFGIAAGSLPVMTPSNMRAQVAAVYMLMVSVGMMLGPPLAGAFNEYIFPEAGGVRYSLITLTSVFGVIGGVSLWLGRRHYAVSLTEADAGVR